MVIVRHEFVEAGHQTLDIDEPVRVAVALGLEHTARRGQTAHSIHQTIVLKVSDQQRCSRHEGAREARAGDIHAAWPGWRGHEAPKSAKAVLPGVARGAAGLPSFPLPCLGVRSGFADGLDAPIRPSAPVLTLAPLKVGGNASIDDAGSDQKAVLVRGCFRRGGNHDRKYGKSTRRRQFRGLSNTTGSVRSGRSFGG